MWFLITFYCAKGGAVVTVRGPRPSQPKAAKPESRAQPLGDEGGWGANPSPPTQNLKQPNGSCTLTSCIQCPVQMWL